MKTKMKIYGVGCGVIGMRWWLVVLFYFLGCEKTRGVLFFFSRREENG